MLPHSIKTNSQTTAPDPGVRASECFHHAAKQVACVPPVICARPCFMASATMPTSRDAQVEEDPTGGKFAGIGGALNSAHHKLEDIIQFHVGDVVTALQRAAMQPGGQEAVIYGTIMGALGVWCSVWPAAVALAELSKSTHVVQQHSMCSSAA